MKFKPAKYTPLILAALFLALLCGVAHCADVTVSWTFATNNTGGTPLTDLAGAKVYYGTASSNYTQVIDVPGGEPGQTVSCTVTGLVEGVTYFLNGTAYNTAGLESDFCTEVAKVAVDTSEAYPDANRMLYAEPATRKAHFVRVGADGFYAQVVVVQRQNEAGIWVDVPGVVGVSQ